MIKPQKPEGQALFSRTGNIFFFFYGAKVYLYEVGGMDLSYGYGGVDKVIAVMTSSEKGFVKRKLSRW